MSGWSCPHELNGTCQHVPGKNCDPGMKGCVLAGRFRFANAAKNRPPRPVRQQIAHERKQRQDKDGK